MSEQIETQVVIYSSYLYMIGGIETFIYNFCQYFYDKYDILVLSDRMDDKQVERLIPFVMVMKNDPSVNIICDTVINQRISDDIPKNIIYKHSVQMVHCIKQHPEWIISQDRDYIVNVSQASKRSFGEEAERGMVINNLLYPEQVEKALILVSAMRVGANDKQGNDERCIRLCNMMIESGIYYKWLYFGDQRMNKEPPGMIYCGCDLDIKPYIKAATYTVQLSGSEAYSYTMLESLALGTPLLCTPLEMNEEMGIVDGENAHIIPFDMDFMIEKILNVPKFKYIPNNKPLLETWREILGDTKPKHIYDPMNPTRVKIIRQYFDVQLQRLVERNEEFTVGFVRAHKLMSLGFAIILE